MVITVDNFKSIQKLREFEIAPVNVLAGANSSGKSSLSQVLLLFKQTLESNSKDMIVLSGKYFEADSLKDVIYQNEGEIMFRLGFDGTDQTFLEGFQQYVQDGEKIKKIDLQLRFRVNGNVHLSLMCFQIEAEEHYELRVEEYATKRDFYRVSSSHELIKGDPTRNFTLCKLELSNFLPTYVIKESKDGTRMVVLLDIMKTLSAELTKYVNKILYISPNRQSPVLAQYYDSTPNTTYIEPDGSNVRYILYANKELKTKATEWICNRLQLAKDMSNVTQDGNKRYHSQLRDHNNQLVDLCQMGYGVSQILPIVVQGLLLPPGGIMIVEDPEAHMHPAVQAAMVDFFTEMAKQGKRFIIETHSDHVVTRIRRRVAEGLSKDMINLTFVEQGTHGSDYIHCELDKNGVFVDRLPKGFLDVQDQDFRAIINSRFLSV